MAHSETATGLSILQSFQKMVRWKIYSPKPSKNSQNKVLGGLGVGAGVTNWAVVRLSFISFVGRVDFKPICFRKVKLILSFLLFSGEKSLSGSPSPPGLRTVSLLACFKYIFVTLASFNHVQKIFCLWLAIVPS